MVPLQAASGISGAAGRRQAARPRGSVLGGGDELLLAVNCRGSSAAQQADQEFVLGDGDAMLATRGSTGFTIMVRGSI
jgi:hypothetical protein